MTIQVFTEEWAEEPAVAVSPPRPTGRVLMFASDATRRRFGADPVVSVARGAGFRRLGDGRYEVGGATPAADRAAHRALLAAVAEEHGPVDTIVHLGAVDDPGLLRSPGPVVALLQALVDEGAEPGRVVLAAAHRDTTERCAAESWLGFERSLPIVLPGTTVTLLAVDAAAAAALPEVVRAELQVPEPSGALWAGGRRLVTRVRAAGPAPATPDPLRRHGVYLITGGMGGLGAVFARRLARDYAARIVLVGRRPEDDAVRHRLAELEAAGGSALYRAADVADEDALRSAVDAAVARFGRIDGVLHAAGVQRRGNIAGRDPETIRAVLAPKIDGTLALDRALAGHTPDFICSFSSSAAILGDFGSCDYAIGNRFQLAHAEHLSRTEPDGPRRLAVCWPLWHGDGMTLADDTTTEFYLRSSGLRLLEPEEGTALLSDLLRRPGAGYLALAGDPDRVRGMLRLTEAVPAGPGSVEDRLTAALKEMVAGILRIPADRLVLDENFREFGFDSLSLVEFAGTLSERLDVPFTPDLFFSYPTLRDLRAHLLDRHAETMRRRYGAPAAGLGAVLREVAGGILRIPADRLVADENFREFGFDSLSLVEFAGTLAERLRIELTPDVFFSYPTLQALEAHLAGRTTQPAPASASAPPPAPTANPARLTRRTGSAAGHRFTAAPAAPKLAPVPPAEAVAIVGMSGRFPGAGSVDEFWELLGADRSAIGPAPVDRDPSWADGRERRFASMAGIAGFDPRFFGIAPSEARTIDPKQRLLLQEMWRALEDAGYGPERLAAERVGVFVGVEDGDYRLLNGDEDPITDNHNAILAARLSYFLNLTGPAVAINTACSSSLVALHQARLSLRNGDCDAAVVAGANLFATPREYDGMEASGMLSPSGTCRTFDKRADGMVPGEAVAAIVLRGLGAAERDRQPVYAVVRGSAVNNDGRTNGITAPSGLAQRRLLDTAYRSAGISPSAVGHVVTHGTGTRLGDPVEINALREAFTGAAAGTVALTSTKPAVGHTLAAAGVVGVIAMALSLRHATIPPSHGCEQVSDFIPWTGSPFFVNRAPRAWTGDRRVGGISAFAFSGTNAHVVLESHPGTAPDEERAGPHLLICSAKSEPALARQLHALAGHLDTAGGSLAAVAHTLVSGRHHFRHRCAVVVHDRAEAVTALRAAAAGAGVRGTAPREFTVGEDGLRAYRDAVAAAAGPDRERALGELARHYVAGHDPAALAALSGDRTPGLVNLPTYRFDETDFWARPQSAPPATAPQPAPPASAPQPTPPASAPLAAATGAPAGDGPGRRPGMRGWTVAECLVHDLAETAGAVLGIPAAELDPDENLAAFGFTSLNIAKLAAETGTRLGFRITPDTFFNHPTLNRLTAHLAAVHADRIGARYAEAAVTPAAPAAAPGTPEPVRVPETDREPIVVVGSSGRFPGARTVDELWSVIAGGREVIGEVPAERRPWWRSGTTGRRLGAVDGAAEFDPLFFEISPRDAALMDPRQRLLLQEMWTALEDAGCAAEAGRVGVFVGAEEGDYRYLVDTTEGLTGTNNSLLAARLAYFLNLSGPAMAINTSCSSGLVALHEACLALRAGDCDTAVVAGASILAADHNYATMENAGMLSPDHTVRAFDKGANGMVPGEAVAVVVLKRRRAAEADGSRILATVLGSGVNYDGRTNGITAPSGDAQAALLGSVYDRSGVDPATIGLALAHGTGTRLGDPIEINALAEAFRTRTAETGFCALTSVKPNLGHSMAASGLVSLICLLEAMRHGTLPPSIHCDDPSDYIDWDGSPFVIGHEARDWPEPAGHPRRGVVSSFGMSGTNAHVVVEGYAAPEPHVPSAAPYHLLLVSAKTEGALARRLTDLAGHLAAGAAELEPVSRTLMTGRHSFAHRCALVVHDLDDAVRQLREAATGASAPGRHRGVVDRAFTPNRTVGSAVAGLVGAAAAARTDPAAYRDHLRALAEFYCQGYPPAFEGLWDVRPPLAGLPAYPFEREHYWAPPVVARSPEPTVDAGVRRFSTRFTGREPILADIAVPARQQEEFA